MLKGTLTLVVRRVLWGNLLDPERLVEPHQVIFHFFKYSNIKGGFNVTDVKTLKSFSH